MEKKLIFFIDFDGTITREDVCYRLIRDFARDGWQQINELWEQGVLSTTECARQTLQLLTIGPDMMERFCHSVDIDPTFVPFVDWTREQGSPLYVLSDGYANYIEVVFRRLDMPIPFYANRLYYRQGWHIRTPYMNQECRKCGVCKTNLIEQLGQADYTTVYIGDGYSDYCPAPRCDILFARDKLAALCDRVGIPYHAYRDFNDIIITIEKNK